MMTSFIPHKYNDSNTLKKGNTLKKVTSNVSNELHVVAKDRKIKSLPSEMCRRRTLVLNRADIESDWGFTLQKYGAAVQKALQQDSVSLTSSCNSSIPADISYNYEINNNNDDPIQCSINFNRNAGQQNSCDYDRYGSLHSRNSGEKGIYADYEIIIKEEEDSFSEDRGFPINEEVSSSINEDKSTSLNEDRTSSFNEDKSASLNEDRTSSFNEDKNKSLNEDRTSTFNVDRSMSLNEDRSMSLNEDRTSSFNVDRSMSLNEDRSKSLNEDRSTSINEDRTSSFNEDRSFSLDDTIATRSLYNFNGRLVATKCFSYVDYIEHKGNAEKAGLRKGDIILSINGECMQDIEHDELLKTLSVQDTSIRLIVLYEACSKRIELYTRYIKLKRLLSEKMFQLRSLENQENLILQNYGRNNDIIRRQSLINMYTTSTPDYDRLSLQIEPTSTSRQYLKVNRNRFSLYSSQEQITQLTRSPTDPQILRQLSSPIPSRGNSSLPSTPLSISTTPRSSPYHYSTTPRSPSALSTIDNDSGYVAYKERSTSKVRRRLSSSNWSLSLDRMRIKSKSKSYLNLPQSSTTLDRPKKCSAHKKKRCSLCDSDTLVEGRSSWFIGPAVMFNPNSHGFSPIEVTSDYRGVVNEGDEITRL